MRQQWLPPSPVNLHHMQSRGAYVKVLFTTAAMQNPEGQKIGKQPRHGDRHHCHPGDRLRVSEALNGLPDDKKGNDHQRNRINKRGKRRQPQPAECMACIRRTTGKLYGGEGKSSAAASVSICPASASSAEPEIKPPMTSIIMKVAVTPKASSKRLALSSPEAWECVSHVIFPDSLLLLV